MELLKSSIPLLKSSLRCDDRYFQHYYLCSYLPLAAGQNDVSLSLIRFKQRTQPDLDAWIDLSSRLLSPLHFPPDTIIIRALRHDETTFRPEFPSAVDLLGQTLAARLDCHYIPDLICKTTTTLPNKHLTRNQRRTQLLDVYRLSAAISTSIPAATPRSTPTPTPTCAPTLTDRTPFLIIDDILTTGSTLRAIIRAIRNRFPDCPIRTFTLTRAADQIPPARAISRP